MSRITLSLPDELHKALKEAAADRGRTIGELVTESIVQYGIKPRRRAAEIVALARRRANLTEAKAMSLAVRETRAARRR